MEKLRVERYSKDEVSAKKQAIIKTVAMSGGVVALALGLFGLTGCTDDDKRAGEQPPPIENTPPPVVGGAGAWFLSDLEELQDSEEA